MGATQSLEEAMEEIKHNENIEKLELSRGHKDYDAKVKNLEGIFAKLEDILDIKADKRTLEEIKRDVANDPTLRSQMFSSSMQLEYEGMAYLPYIKRIEELTEKVENESYPYYELYLLYTKINLKISEINAANIIEITQDGKELIKAINSLNTHNEKDKNALIESAYQTLYSLIIYEQLFDRSETLNYLKELNVDANKENIGRLLAQDLKTLGKDVLIEEDLRGMKTEGLGYDYLTTDVVRKISRNTVGEQNSEYQERRRDAINDISEKVNNLVDERKELGARESDIKKSLSVIHMKKALLLTKAISILMIPIITITAGNMIGKNKSSKVKEYQTITRTINLETGEVIGEPEIVYDEKETTYVATVLEYGPYRKNPTGVGYIRNVTAYEYVAPENADEMYHATSEDLQGNVLEKYSYVEPKETLNASDSTTDSTILITETYQNKNETKPSTKYNLGFTILGVVAGLAIDTALILLQFYSFSEIEEMFRKLNHDIKTKKLEKEEIKEELLKLKEKTLLLQDEYNDVVTKYGSFGENMIPSEFAKKRKKN